MVDAPSGVLCRQHFPARRYPGAVARTRREHSRRRSSARAPARLQLWECGPPRRRPAPEPSVVMAEESSATTRVLPRIHVEAQGLPRIPPPLILHSRSQLLLPHLPVHSAPPAPPDRSTRSHARDAREIMTAMPQRCRRSVEPGAEKLQTARLPSFRGSCTGGALLAPAFAKNVARRRSDRGPRRYVARASSAASPPSAPRGKLWAGGEQASTSWPQCGPTHRGSRRGRTRLGG